MSRSIILYNYNPEHTPKERHKNAEYQQGFDITTQSIWRKLFDDPDGLAHLNQYCPADVQELLRMVVIELKTNKERYKADYDKQEYWGDYRLNDTRQIAKDLIKAMNEHPFCSIYVEA